MTVKRKCEVWVSVEASEIFSQGGELECYGDLSWGDPSEKPEDLSDCEPAFCAHVHVVPDVTGVLVSPSSVVTEFCDGFSCCSEWEFANRSPCLSPKSVHFVVQVRKRR